MLLLSSHFIPTEIQTCNLAMNQCGIYKKQLQPLANLELEKKKHINTPGITFKFSLPSHFHLLGQVLSLWRSSLYLKNFKFDVSKLQCIQKTYMYIHIYSENCLTATFINMFWFITPPTCSNIWENSNLKSMKLYCLMQYVHWNIQWKVIMMSCLVTYTTVLHKSTSVISKKWNFESK